MKRIISLGILLLFLPLVIAEPYNSLWDENLKVEVYDKEYRWCNEEDRICVGSEIRDRCWNILYNINDTYLEGIKLIRIYDLPLKYSGVKGYWFPSGIINIYDGCKDREYLIHELTHQKTHLDKVPLYRNINHLDEWQEIYLEIKSI